MSGMSVTLQNFIQIGQGVGVSLTRMRDFAHHCLGLYSAIFGFYYLQPGLKVRRVAPGRRPGTL